MMDIDEQKIADFLNTVGLSVEEFTKEERQQSQTPDFRVFREGKFVFFCEVKAISRDEWSYGGRNDPVFNRISNKVHEAVQQFDAVNPDLEHPNVLAFVNHDNKCDSFDLIATTTGYFKTKENNLYPIYSKFSDGRIKEEKFRIHLYIWIDDFKGSRYLFNKFAKNHYVDLCGYFGIDPSSIKDIYKVKHSQQ